MVLGHADCLHADAHHRAQQGGGRHGQPRGRRDGQVYRGEHGLAHGEDRDVGEEGRGALVKMSRPLKARVGRGGRAHSNVLSCTAIARTPVGHPRAARASAQKNLPNNRMTYIYGNQPSGGAFAARALRRSPFVSTRFDPFVAANGCFATQAGASTRTRGTPSLSFARAPMLNSTARVRRVCLDVAGTPPRSLSAQRRARVPRHGRGALTHAPVPSFVRGTGVWLKSAAHFFGLVMTLTSPPVSTVWHANRTEGRQPLSLASSTGVRSPMLPSLASMTSTLHVPHWPAPAQFIALSIMPL
mmetsp:Transcript_60320/g.165693  ORF Transcript_60320/g.165693 Transcript_60320/m.165693 type:complete len:300 (+) Transcript_60320:677-1576(+)